MMAPHEGIEFMLATIPHRQIPSGVREYAWRKHLVDSEVRTDVNSVALSLWLFEQIRAVSDPPDPKTVILTPRHVDKSPQIIRYQHPATQQLDIRQYPRLGLQWPPLRSGQAASPTLKKKEARTSRLPRRPLL